MSLQEVATTGTGEQPIYIPAQSSRQTSEEELSIRSTHGRVDYGVVFADETSGLIVSADIFLPIPDIANETVRMDEPSYPTISYTAVSRSRVDTFVSEADILTKMVESDIIVQMPPKRRYTIDLDVTSVRRAEPKAVIPDWVHF
jgi:hypothetical protein